jgi:hypothetical protein
MLSDGSSSGVAQIVEFMNGTTDFMAVTCGSSTTRALSGSSSNIYMEGYLIGF